MSPDICEAPVSPTDSNGIYDDRMWIWLVEYGCYAKREDIQGNGYINSEKKRETNKTQNPKRKAHDL